MKKFFPKLFLRDGQVMMVSVIMLGSALLAAGAVAGILMVYQARQTNDAENSTKAFFAADAGLEWQSYCINKLGGVECGLPGVSTSTPIVFQNNVSASSGYEYVGAETVVSAQGFSGNTTRALETIFISGVSSTAPTLTFVGDPLYVVQNQPTTLEWSFSDIYGYCTASSDPLSEWVGNKGISGSEIITPSAFGINNFSLQCTSSNGDTNKTVVIRKVTRSYNLSVSLLSSGGYVSSTPSGIYCISVQGGPSCTSDFPESSPVTLVAYPDADHTFEVWGGDCAHAGLNPVCILTMDGDKNVTATFTMLNL